MSGPTTELSVVLPPESADSLIGLLSVRGFEGFWEDGETLRAYCTAERWDDETRAAVHESLTAFASGHEIPLPRVSIRLIPPQNWNAAWEATIRPVSATGRIVIAPSWHPVQPSGDQIVLTIDPKMSFGTGHHETTRLMLQLLEPRVSPGCTLLDVGTGTGVLAIAAVKLGAASATGVDNDGWSFENARENAEANGVGGAVSFLLGELADVPPGRFDLVAANIQRSVIEPLLAPLLDRVTPGGSLLLSGILDTERNAMIEAFNRQRATLGEERTEHEWIAFALVVR